MAGTVHFNVTDQVSADLRRLEAALTDLKPVNQAIGGEVQRLTQDHLRQVNVDRPNKLGGIRTNYYARAARATFFTLAGDGLDLTIAQQGFRQRYQGGTIRPVKAHWLTLPVAPEAYGHRAGEFDHLKFIPISGAMALLVADEGGQAGRAPMRNKSGQLRNRKTTVAEGETMFVLVRKVDQKGDETIIPSESEYQAAIGRAVADWVATIGGRN